MDAGGGRLAASTLTPVSDTDRASTTTESAPRRGRPRLVAQRRSGGSLDEEILDAAAELFTTHGYAATSTRAIAEAVGVRQASLYHYFPTKDAILTALLDQTVRASLNLARELVAAAGDPAAARLARLVEFDARQLAASKWNLGALYLLPELRADEFAEFRAARTELADHYATLAADMIGDADDPRVLLPFRLVESVIAMRSDGDLTSDSRWNAAAVTASIGDAVRALLG